MSKKNGKNAKVEKVNCENCTSKREFNKKEFCSLRGSKPTESSCEPIGKEHFCTWKKEKKPIENS